MNWLRSRVDWWALLQNPDMFMLRVSFIRECERPAAVRQFLKEVSQEATAGTVALERYRTAAQADLPEMSALAIELAEHLLAAYRRWAKRS